MRLLLNLVRSAEIVVEASRLDVPVNGKRAARTRENRSLFPEEC